MVVSPKNPFAWNRPAPFRSLVLFPLVDGRPCCGAGEKPTLEFFHPFSVDSTALDNKLEISSQSSVMVGPFG